MLLLYQLRVDVSRNTTMHTCKLDLLRRHLQWRGHHNFLAGYGQCLYGK